jgi:uncharacterized membrane protein HdeD (DUF308 family)
MITADNWRVLLFRGVIAIAFGCLALLWPGLTLAMLAGFFAAFALLSGVGAFLIGVRARGRRGAWAPLLEGVLGIAAAVVAVLYPGMTAIALLVVIAVWAILSGASAIAAATLLERDADSTGGLPIFGMLSVLLGIVLLVQPFAGALALAWMIALYALVSGTTYVVLALRTRRVARLAHA